MKNQYTFAVNIYTHIILLFSWLYQNLYLYDIDSSPINYMVSVQIFTAILCSKYTYVY